MSHTRVYNGLFLVPCIVHYTYKYSGKLPTFANSFSLSLLVLVSPPVEIRRPSAEGMMSPPLRSSCGFNTSDCSNSSWAEMETYVIGNIQMHPLTLCTKQLFILKYLTPMGEYQEVFFI